jgi:cell division septation protein DedD
MRKFLFLLLSILLFSQSGFSQNQSKTEKKAIKYFNKAFYEEAMPLIDKLIKTKDKDPYINYMYGVCSVETGNSDPKRTLQRLQFAKDNHIDEEDILYYLARAEQESFHINEAINIYQSLIEKNNIDNEIIKLAKEELTKCQNAKGINTDAIQEIIWKKDANYHTFYKLYDFDQNKYGTILLVPDELGNSNNEIDLAFIPPTKDVIYFSRYDKNTKSKDLFQAPINKNGKYEEPVRLTYFVNGEGDEEFPFLSYDQNVLYFTSTGHKSMGGQDVYKTTYSLSNDWSKPTKLGIKINSSFNDFAFFFLGDQDIAYFASDRFHSDGKISVYKVKLSNAVSENLNNVVIASGKELNMEKNQEEKVPISVKEKATKIIKTKKYATQTVDSAFTKTDILSAKEDNFQEKIIHTRNIEYTKNIEAKDLFNKYLHLCSQTLNENDTTTLLSLKSNINNILKQAELTKYKAAVADTLNRKLKISKTKLHNANEELKSIAGEMQLLLAANKTEEIKDKYTLFKTNFSLADSIPDYSADIRQLSQVGESPTNENLIDMNRFINQKIEIIRLAGIEELLQNTHLQESNSSINELLSLSIASFGKHIEQKKSDDIYLKNDIISFMNKALAKQAKEIEQLKNTGYSYDPITQTETSEDNTDYLPDNTTNDTYETRMTTAGETQETNSESAKPSFITTDDTGIRYRVQLGVFSNDLELSRFSSVPELSKIYLPGKDMIKIFSGNYTDYNEAGKAKQALKPDFPDAFVVAFDEGVKIPLAQAFNKQKEHQITATEQTNNTKPTQVYIPQQNQKVNSTYNTDVKQNNGTLFYLQIGTYSQPKISAQLYNISPLLYEIMPNKLYRYFTGPFATQEEAESAVADIRSKGATSAFVVAYKNGKKIQLDGENPPPSPPKRKILKSNESGISYRIQIGAFSKRKNQVWIKDMQQRTGAEIKVVTLDNGINIYTAGTFSSKEEAANFKQGLIDKGFSGVFVAAFKDGKKIPLK